MLNSFIWPINRFLSGATSAGQSEPGSDGNEKILCIRQSSSLAIWLFSVISGHSLEESYFSAEMQSVYSAAPADWDMWNREPQQSRRQRFLFVFNTKNRRNKHVIHGSQVKTSN